MKYHITHTKAKINSMTLILDKISSGNNNSYNINGGNRNVNIATEKHYAVGNCKLQTTFF